MEEITENQVAEVFGLDLSEPETKAMWDDAGRIMERFRETQQILIDTWQRLQPMLIRVERLLRPYYVVTPGYHRRKPKKRSRRGIAVQEKRKRLGLNVDGKFPGMNRKDSYRLANKDLV